MAQIHLAGHSQLEKYIVDTHDAPVKDEVWQIYAEVINRLGKTNTLLEWDANIPSFETVHNEALKANLVVESRSNRLSKSA